MMSKLISVIMPCYNAGRYISQALDGISSQTYTNWELIAVDDCGPEDDTEVKVRSFAKEHRAHRVEFIKHLENKGVSAARNTAISNAKGDLIALLDPDDIWMPTHLEKGITQFEDDDNISFYSSFAKLFKNNDLSNDVGIEGYTNWELKAFPSILCIRNAIPNSSSILKSNVFKEVGLYDEKIHIGEDCDLWIRIVSQNLKYYINREPTIYYRKHSLSATDSAKQVYNSKHPFALKHKNWIQLNQRQALDAQIRHIFLLEAKMDNLKTVNTEIETRLRVLENTLNKFKSLPIIEQILKVKLLLKKRL